MALSLSFSLASYIALLSTQMCLWLFHVLFWGVCGKVNLWKDLHSRNSIPCLSSEVTFFARRYHFLLTNPIRYGLPASPRRWDVKLCKATAVARRVGITTYCTKYKGDNYTEHHSKIFIKIIVTYYFFQIFFFILLYFLIRNICIYCIC